MTEQSVSEVKLVLTGENASATTSLEEVSQRFTVLQEQLTAFIEKLDVAVKTFSDFGKAVTDVADMTARMSGSMSRLGTNMTKQADTTVKASDTIVKSMEDITKAVEQTTATDTKMLKDFADAQNAAAMASYEATAKIDAETQAQRAQTEATMASTSATRQYKHDQMLAIIAVQMMGTAIAGVGLVGARLFTGAIKSAMDFQAMMSRVGAALKTTGGDTQQNIKNLSSLAMQLDQTSLYSMNDIGDMMQALAKQGLTYQQIYGGAAKATITLAQATDTSLTNTGTVVTDMMHEFNLSGSQLTPVINGISGAMHMANISMTNFYDSMKYVGPLASQLGLNFDDVSQSIGLLAQHGIKGTQAGTTLRRMLMNLQPSTKAATAEFQQLGLITASGTNVFYNANGTLKSMGNIISILHSHLQGLSKAQQEQALRTMFGVYALSGMEVVANTTTQQWNALTKSMSNTTAAQVAAEKMNNLQGHLKEFTSTLQTIGTEMATFMLPALDKLVQGLQRLAGWFKSLSPQTQHIAFIILGVVSALLVLTGTVMTFAATMTFLTQGFGIAIDGFKLFKTGIFAVTSPWGLLITAIIAGVILVMTHWKQINQWMQQHFGVTIPQILHNLGQWFTNTFNDIKKVIGEVISWIAPYVKAEFDAFMGYFKVALDLLTGKWGKAWTDIKTTLSKVWNDIKNTQLGKMIQDALDFGKNLIDSIANGIMSRVHAVEASISNAINGIKKLMGFGGSSPSVSVGSPTLSGSAGFTSGTYTSSSMASYTSSSNSRVVNVGSINVNAGSNANSIGAAVKTQISRAIG